MKHTWILLLLAATLLTAAPALSQGNGELPLTEPGPFAVGVTTRQFADPLFPDRALATTLWYPAAIAADEAEAAAARLAAGQALVGAEPDETGAPYPLIVYSHEFGASPDEDSDYTQHLTSYGFVVVSIFHPDTEEEGVSLINRTFHSLAMVEQFAAAEDDPIAAITDFETVGVTGFGDGGTTAASLAGAQVDPNYVLNWVFDAPPDQIFGINFITDAWSGVEAQRQLYEPALTDGERWPATPVMGVQAAVLIAPCFAPLFGPDGLASVTVPTLTIAGERDDVCFFERDAEVFNQSITSDPSALLAIPNEDHDISYFSENRPYLLHFATAFFGSQLRGEDEFAEYLTADYAEDVADLDWVE